MNKQEEKISKWRKMESQDLLSLLEQLNRRYGVNMVMVKGENTKTLSGLESDSASIKYILEERLRRREQTISGSPKIKIKI